MSKYQISAETDNFQFLDQIFPKRVFLVEIRKGEHHYLILHIRIRVGIKFRFEQTILNF